MIGDSCYSRCVSSHDFNVMRMGKHRGTGNPQYQPTIFGPEASKYGELPHYFSRKIEHIGS